MPSLLSRIRNRVSSTQPSAQSVSTPPTPTPLEATPNLIDATPSPLLGLMIRPDLNALLESYETEDISPRRQNKGSPAVPAPSSSQEGYRPLSPNPNMSRNILTKSPEHTLPTTPVSTGQPTFPIFAEASPISGTFGRQQSPLANLSLAGSGSPHRRALTRSWSLGETANLDQKLTGAQRSGWEQTPTVQLPLSGTFERSSSTRSLPDENRRIDRRRRTNTRSLSSSRASRSRSPATPRPNRTPSSITHRSRSVSPRTFGHPTPPYSSRTFGRHESPPPPLPPLDRPELILDARGSRPTTLGILHQSSKSAATVLHVDGTPGIPQEPASGPSVRHKPAARKRSKTFSVDSGRSSRRSSAEWSSVQATEGVLTDSNSWQAQVSREIVRLSLGEPVALPEGDPGNGRNFSHVSATRQDPPVEAFVSPRPPSSLGSLLFLQDSNPLSSPSEYRGGDQAVVTGDEYNKHKRMTEQGTSTLQVANNPSNTKGKQPLKSSLRASSSTPRYSAISTVLATPTRLENQSSDSGGSKGKRKADAIDITPPDQKSLHAKFAVPEDLPLEKRTGSDLQVPSSFRAKRARLSTSSYSPSPSRPGVSPNATNTGTWTSSTSSKIRSLSRQQSVTKPPSSKTNSYRSDIPSDRIRLSERYERTRSMSQLSHTSIPVSALVSPRAPSVSKSLTSAYHMRDPRKPPRVQPTPWSLRFRTEVEDGSPIHAWFFFLGFILFPLWWFAAVWRIPQTRRVGGSEVEKAVTLDDPQVEHDARTWRFRCRIMAGVSLITYIPFIVLVSIYAH